MAERARALIPDRYGLPGRRAVCGLGVRAPPAGPPPRSTGGANAGARPPPRGAPGCGRCLRHERGRAGTNRGQAVVLVQARASLRVDSLGSVGIMQPATDPERSGLPALIEEEVGDRLARSLRLTAWILDRIDPVRWFTHVAPTVGLLSAAYLGWRTRGEHMASPNSIQMSMSVGDRVSVGLTPAARPRGALTYEVPELTEDFIALLRRTYKA